MKKFRKEEKFQAYNEEHSHVTIPNMMYKDNPPQFIAIIGPPNCGKSLIKGRLLKHWTKEDVDTEKIVTLKAKTKRISLYEGNNSIEDMIDTIKVADVLIMPININVGLEKETLEAINMINAHGFTKMCFLYTHMEEGSRIKNQRGRMGRGVEKKTKSEIDKRISSEFTFPIQILDAEQDSIEKIARHIDLIKTRPVEWRCTHSHVIVDAQEGECLYGYVRGAPFLNNRQVHVPGHGDYTISMMRPMQDPCDALDKRAGVYVPGTVELSEKAEPRCSAKTDSKPCIEAGDTDENNCALSIEAGGNDENSCALGIEAGNTDENSCTLGIEAGNTDENSCTLGGDAGNSDDYGNGSGIDSDDVEMKGLKSRVARKFKSDMKSEKDLVSKFHEEYQEKGERGAGLNTLQKKKIEEANRKEIIDKTTEGILPGTYCKIWLKPLAQESRPVQLTPDKLLVLGGYASNEMKQVFLKGKIAKNKWQTMDLKTNSPFFISMGWCRFQTVPVFGRENRLVKYLRTTNVSKAHEMLFYGPSVPSGTSFVIFDATKSYRILASGQVLDASGVVEMKRKIKLIGYPKQVMGQTAIIQSMFSSDVEASRFVHARLTCASGLRGIIKNTIGRSGDFRATFEGTLLGTDIVFVKCHAPVEPLTYMKHMVPGERYVRAIKELKEERGMPLYEESVEEESSEVVVRNHEGSSIQKRLEMTKKRLEVDLPYDKRREINVKDGIDLPISPERRAYEEELNRMNEKRKAKDEDRVKELEKRKKQREEKLEKEREEKELKKRKNAVDNKEKMGRMHKKHKSKRRG